MRVNGIPTTYAGIQFRSRLEATWAAFFDLCGWHGWQYEPFDLNGYIPDFIFPARDHLLVVTKILIEVKPELDLGALRLHTEKIGQSGWIGPVVIAGASPMLNPSGGMVIGLGGARYEASGLVWDGDGSEFINCQTCRRISFTPTGGPGCWICGTTADFDDKTVIDGGLIRSLWNTAKNRTQWRGQYDGDR